MAGLENPAHSYFPAVSLALSDFPQKYLPCPAGRAFGTNPEQLT